MGHSLIIPYSAGRSTVAVMEARDEPRDLFELECGALIRGGTGNLKLPLAAFEIQELARNQRGTKSKHCRSFNLYRCDQWLGALKTLVHDMNKSVVLLQHYGLRRHHLDATPLLGYGLFMTRPRPFGDGLLCTGTYLEPVQGEGALCKGTSRNVEFVKIKNINETGGWSYHLRVSPYDTLELYGRGTIYPRDGEMLFEWLSYWLRARLPRGKRKTEGST